MGDRAPEPSRPSVWDCGSNLYDSFERTSFERQLDSAISSRSYSMPHDRFVPVSQQQKPPATYVTEVPKKSAVTSKSILRKFLRSVFRVKTPEDARIGGSNQDNGVSRDLCKVSAGLPSIPESRERNFSPSLLGSVSERFTITATWSRVIDAPQDRFRAAP